MLKRGLQAIILISSLLPVLLYTTTTHALLKKDRKYYEARGEVVWEVPTQQKVMALTFDDGPNPNYTPQILQLLKQYKARATFFLVGSRVKSYPDIARRAAQEGHELANHTFRHPYMKRLSAEGIREEILKTQQMITDATGQKPHLFRPPGGYYNDRVVNTAKQEGFLVVMWSWHQDTRDWTDPGVRRIVNKVLKNARPGDIVLFHDHGGDRQQTVNALKEILPELKRQGYKFVTVSELLKLRNQFPVNRTD